MRVSLFRRKQRLFIAAAALASLGLAPAAVAAGHAPGDHLGRPLDRQGDHQSDVAAHQRNQAKQVSPAEQRAQLTAARADAAAQARRLGLDSREKLVVKNVVADADGTLHTRYERTFDGLKVIGGDLVVHQHPNGHVYRTDRAHRGSIAVASTYASVSRTTARARALASARQAEGVRASSLSAPSEGAHLVVYAAGKAPVLAWESVVSGVKADQTPTQQHVVVDARTGKVLTRWDGIETADNGTGHSIYSGTVAIGTTAVSGGYQLRDAGRGGNYTINLNHAQSGGSIFTDADNVWGNGSQSDAASAAVDAHYGAAMTWDYYLNRHGRQGIFDNGQGVPSRVHYGNSYVNAFWDGSQMTYGDGQNNADPLVELDVAGHEMSHGVTEHTAGLDYTGDAGGLNESTSDIFGTAVEWYANNSSDVPDYLIGEEIDINGNGTPLRYMDKPSKDGGSYDCWSSSVGNADPHYSSGPGNHWYYLASEGSGSKVINGVSYNSPTCDGSSFTGIGHQQVEDVWYRALSTYMTSTETYPQARDDSIQAAIDLYGADSAECTGIEKAWSAIDVPAGSTSCTGGGGDPGPDPSGCDLGTTATGSLSGSGDYAYEPEPSGYYYSSARTIKGCLDGPSGADYDLYLQKYSSGRWVTVAQGISSTAHEEVSYPAGAGYYSWVVQSYTGSGGFTFSMN